MYRGWWGAQSIPLLACFCSLHEEELHGISLTLTAVVQGVYAYSGIIVETSLARGLRNGADICGKDLFSEDCVMHLLLGRSICSLSNLVMSLTLSM